MQRGLGCRIVITKVYLGTVVKADVSICISSQMAALETDGESCISDAR